MWKDDCLRRAGKRETAGICSFFEELSEERTPTVARSLSRSGELDTNIRSLSDTEVQRLKGILADLFRHLEETQRFEEAAVISTALDRIRDEHRWRSGDS